MEAAYSQPHASGAGLVVRHTLYHTASWRSHLWHSRFKRDLHEADAFVCLLPTAKAVGYASTTPTGLVSSAAAHYTP